MENSLWGIAIQQANENKGKSSGENKYRILWSNIRCICFWNCDKVKVLRQKLRCLFLVSCYLEYPLLSNSGDWLILTYKCTLYLLNLSSTLEIINPLAYAYHDFTLSLQKFVFVFLLNFHLEKTHLFWSLKQNLWYVFLFEQYFSKALRVICKFLTFQAANIILYSCEM